MRALTGQALRLGLVGPVPPPAGGMANQTRQLAELLAQEGVDVEVVRVNAPYRPEWIQRFKGLRALFRLFPYLLRLWSATGRVQLVHVMANSGWSWHLFAAPAIWIAALRGKPVVVNYRGGEAESFFDKWFVSVRPSLKRVNRIIVPSGFLQEVFRNRGFDSAIVPNIIDLSRFTRVEQSAGQDSSCEPGPNILVARNLEPIYDNATALRAFALVKERIPEARLTIAGAGPERGRLVELATELGIQKSVRFVGRVDNAKMPALYQSADVMLNPSLADNMPISVLEALASGVPVVSTNVGGVPYLVKDGETARLVPARDADTMATALVEVLADRGLAERLRTAGLDQIGAYAWVNVREKLLAVYRSALASGGPTVVAEPR